MRKYIVVQELKENGVPVWYWTGYLWCNNASDARQFDAKELAEEYNSNRLQGKGLVMELNKVRRER